MPGTAAAIQGKSQLQTLFGASGSGKTRMLKVIEKQYGHKRCLRLGAETLVDEILAPIRSGLMPGSVVDQYRDTEVLLIDNLWVLASRPRLSNTIRKLIEARMAEGRLTVLASDLSVAEWGAQQPELAVLLSEGETVLLN